ncbi:MAG: TetR family transcriptional regulator [Gammaproteobacteria bacterium]|nr:TetR family transcriptional regulator [Gammaproteobacteria bacterium]
MATIAAMSRHAEYDRTTVIASATAVFWDKGYGKTSVGDLVAATGLQPGSLYAAFGNKKGLFLEVLEQYNQEFIATVRSLRAGEGASIGKIHGLLEQIVDKAAAGEANRGCLTVNALLEVSQHDADIANRLNGYNAELRKAFAWIIKDAQAEGDVPADRNANELASLVINNIWGMRVMCKSRPDRASLEAIVTGVVCALRH